MKKTKCRKIKFKRKQRTQKKTLKNYNKGRGIISKHYLKKEFEQYIKYGGDLFDPTDDELYILTQKAAKILKKKDFQNKFWKKIISKIFIGLKEENNYLVNSNSNSNSNYNLTKKAFKKLLKTFMIYDADSDPNYLNNDYLFEKLEIEKIIKSEKS